MTIKTVHLSPYVSVQGEESEVAKYGRRNVPKMIGQVDKLRHLIAAEGSPAIQDAWGDVEEHIDYAYRTDFSKLPIAKIAVRNPSGMSCDVPHRIRTLDGDQQAAFDWTQPDQPVSRSLMRIVYLFAALVLSAVIAAWFYAIPAHAIPGSTQNPDGSWTGPNGEDLGGGDPQDRPQSREGNRTGKMTCGCDASGQEWFVILRDGVVTATDRLACERLAVKVRECR